MRKLFLFILMLLPLMASADPVKIDGIYYNLYSSDGVNKAVVTSHYNEWYSDDIVIPESVPYADVTYNVTSIGYSAFYGCTGLTSITIPSSVTSIEDYAFADCSSLTSITIPNSITSIDDYAFAGCSSLTSITIPNSVTSIGGSAFSGCTGLTSITIPNSVTSIGPGAFSGTAWYDNQPDGVAYAGNVLYSYKGTMPEGTKIDIKDGTLGIAEEAFQYCMGLTSITIPNSVTSISERAFFYCSGLTTITIPNSVTSIGSYAFQYCSGLTSITIPNSVTSIGDNAFYKCSGLKDVKISVTDLSSFCNNSNVRLISDNIGKPVSLVDNEGIEIVNLIIPDDVTSIGQYSFYNCSGLSSVTIPNSVTSIGKSAFYGCYNMSTAVIGSGVTSIGESAFSYLKIIIWLTNTPPSGASNARGLINYVANNEYSFSNKIVYPFLSSFFDVDGIRYVPVSLSDKTCDAIDCVYNESAKDTKIASTVTYKGVSLSVKSIQPYIGYGNKFIESLTIDNDGELGEYAFTDCSNMKSIIIGSKVSSIGSYAFQGCSSLESVTIPNLVEVIRNYTFDGCSALKELVIGKNVKIINQYAFSGCNALPSIEIPQAVTEIKDNVFAYCTGLKKVIIADSENELKLGSNGSNPLFSYCPLDSVYIGRNINYITTQSYGYSPFYRNTTLRAVKIADKETEISENEFYGCTNLQRVIIGDGVTSIGNWAFSGCSSLKFFTFGSEVKTIGQEAFSDCTAVTEITSRAITPPTCGNQALDDINKWECKLYVPKGYLTDYQAADQWKEFLFAEEGDYTIAKKYTLTYIVDGEVYKTYQVAEGSSITPEPAPTKDGYDFSGWSAIPSTMPSEDVTITGTFTVQADEDVIKITSVGQTTWCSTYDLDFT